MKFICLTRRICQSKRLLIYNFRNLAMMCSLNNLMILDFHDMELLKPLSESIVIDSSNLVNLIYELTSNYYQKYLKLKVSP
jgi:hypothetical protein